MLALLLVTVVLGLVAADPAPAPDHYAHGSYGYRGYGGHGGHGRGYGRQHSYSRHGSHYYDYPGHDSDKPLDGIDKLYKRLDTLQSELKTASEIMGNLEARLSLGKKLVDELSYITLPRLIHDDEEQNDLIGSLDSEANDVSDKIQITADDLALLVLQNNANLEDQQTIGELYAVQRRTDITQDGNIASLLTQVDDFKPKLTTVIDNQFKLMGIRMSESQFLLDRLKDIESKRMCEVGQVTLDYDDRKTEYLFQSTFAVVPQVLHTVCGYNFDMEKRPKADGYYKEPNALGLHVTADASKTGVTLELFDYSFGDTGIETVDVCFQVCSIGPGPGDAVADITLYYS